MSFPSCLFLYYDKETFTMADFKKGVSLMTDTSEAAVPEAKDVRT